jgi:hypothetical protein
MTMPILPSLYELPTRSPDFVSTALHWYAELMLATVPFEGAIACSIACLEALFLGDNPSTELQYRLTQRTISLLRSLGWNPLEMRKVIGEAYKVRSKYVHGASQKKMSQENLRELYQRVGEYSRIACLTWIQLAVKNGQKRDEVLRLLDDALVDDDSRARLGLLCSHIEFALKVEDFSGESQ